MMNTVFHRAFTLLEVNLAILVMAGCVLSVVVLYSLGFRENAQSKEDVAAAAYADAVIGKMVTALSDPNIDWEDFKKVVQIRNGKNRKIAMNPESGWGEYFDLNTGLAKSDSTICGTAARVFKDTIGKVSSASGVGSDIPTPGSDSIKAYGLVVQLQLDRKENPLPVVQIAFRAAKDGKSLLSSPLYYAEVAFQGKQPALYKEKD